MEADVLSAFDDVNDYMLDPSCLQTSTVWGFHTMDHFSSINT